MKTINLFILLVLLVVSLPCKAEVNYIISFSGTGASNTVGEVIVQNLSKRTSISVPSGNVLNLFDGLSDIKQLNANNANIRIYPNFKESTTTLSFFAIQTGNTQINVYSLDGKKIIYKNLNLQAGCNMFQLSLPKGTFIAQILGNGYKYSAKIINLRASFSKTQISYIGAEMTKSVTQQKSKHSAVGTTMMAYSENDILLFIGTYGNYSTIITDIPTASKTISFNFVACADSDGNNYKVVKIGTQTWMAENLRTTKYNDGISIPNVTDETIWENLSTPAYCWYNNNATTFQKNIFGALYNWYTVKTSKLAPLGWHVPTDAEWSILENYLLTNGYNYDGSTKSNKFGKSLAAATNWYPSYDSGNVGCDLTKNNKSGFSALPSGKRMTSGIFVYQDSYGYWWSSSEESGYSWIRSLHYYRNDMYRNIDLKQNGYSVRCIMN